ncbi:MAG: hypothetical protein IAE64_08150 [Flavobacteriales bacterium]|nr:hypothetical protein [Flavobacteriales bacterium]MCC6330509.1 hypothetical protein [Ignavibacteria bacterium]MCL4276897.1 hypothetical protein [Ignavibacteria bacterium]
MTDAGHPAALVAVPIYRKIRNPAFRAFVAELPSPLVARQEQLVTLVDGRLMAADSRNACAGDVGLCDVHVLNCPLIQSPLQPFVVVLIQYSAAS